MPKKLQLRICHPEGVLKVVIGASDDVKTLKTLIREKLEIEILSDHLSKEAGDMDDPVWIQSCFQDTQICGDLFKKRGAKVQYRFEAKKKAASVTDTGSSKDNASSHSIDANVTSDDQNAPHSSLSLPSKDSITNDAPPGEWKRGDVCFAQLESGEWIYATILKISKRKRDDTVRTVNVYESATSLVHQGIPESRLRSEKEMTTFSLPPLLEEVTTSFGPAFLIETYRNGWCSVGFGYRGRDYNRMVAITNKLTREYLEKLSASDTTMSLETMKELVVEGRQLAKRCFLSASPQGAHIRVMRHLVRLVHPRDRPLPKIEPKSGDRGFSVGDMDRDLARRKAYEIELHGHNFNFTQWQGGPTYKVKIELHESATVGHLFSLVSEKLQVPEEFLCLRKYWMRDIKRKPKETSLEYLQVQGFGYLMKAPRDQPLFEPRLVRTQYSARGQTVHWFNRRDEIIVDDLRPIEFRRKIKAVTQFDQPHEHVLRSERFKLGR